MIQRFEKGVMGKKVGNNWHDAGITLNFGGTDKASYLYTLKRVKDH